MDEDSDAEQAGSPPLDQAVGVFTGHTGACTTGLLSASTALLRWARCSPDAVFAVAWGKAQLASGGGDDTLRLWQVSRQPGSPDCSAGREH